MIETMNSNSRTLTSPFEDVCRQWHQSAKNLEVFNELLTRDAKIALTPKQLIWTLNKAKLYRYTPQVPDDQRHRIPLLLVFAVMNRPYV